MTDHKTVPIIASAEAVRVPTGKHVSLVGRGLMSIQNNTHLKISDEDLYRQARSEFDRSNYLYGWYANENIPLFSVFNVILQLANKGFGKAYYPLAALYQNRRDIDNVEQISQHFAKLAFDWCFTNRVNQDAEIFCDLGEMYEGGLGILKDENQAEFWFSKAAKMSCARGQFHLGWICCEKDDRDDDWDNGYDLIRFSAEQGFAPAQFYLGSGPDDTDVAWNFLAAEQGLAVALYFMGHRYEHGHGVPENIEEAVKWYRLAADAGYIRAQDDLGRMYSMYSKHQFHEDAFKWNRILALHGDKRGQSRLATMYANGFGVVKNLEEAAKWDRLAAQQGDLQHKFALGERFFSGKLLVQDYSEALKWYRMAADGGYAAAQRAVGRMYDNGFGVSQNYVEAVNWYLLAAGQGFAHAQCDLGGMYTAGRGVSEDQKEANKWFRLAAEQGNATAQYIIGNRCANGFFEVQDPVETVKWLKLSAIQGFPQAQDDLEKLGIDWKNNAP